MAMSIEQLDIAIQEAEEDAADLREEGSHEEAADYDAMVQTLKESRRVMQQQSLKLDQMQNMRHSAMGKQTPPPPSVPRLSTASPLAALPHTTDWIPSAFLSVLDTLRVKAHHTLWEPTWETTDFASRAPSAHRFNSPFVPSNFGALPFR